MERLLNYRFPEGSMAGQSFGNLFLAALGGISDNFDEAIARMSDVLAVSGRVLPVSQEPTVLEALFENGTRVTGESRISAFKKEQKCRIREVHLLPKGTPARAQVLGAIAEAELIVLGPGSLYTSIIPTLLAAGICDAIRASRALRVYVCNIMTQEGETEGYSCFDHARELMHHAGGPIFDVCLVNNTPIAPDILARYAGENASATVIDRALFGASGLEVRERPLVRIHNRQVRHHPLRLTHALLELYMEKHRRTALYGEQDALLLAWMREQIAEEDKSAGR